MATVAKEIIPVSLFILVMIWIFSYFISKPLHRLSDAVGDLSSKNILNELDKVGSWYYEVKQLKDAMILSVSIVKEKMEALISDANTDVLTGLFNRRGLYEYLESYPLINSSCSIISADIDYFKRVNDTYGHDVGDETIWRVASFLKNNLRETDIACRTGGEEFILVLPNATITESKVIAERIRKLIEEYNMPVVGKITISMGVTSFIPEDISFDYALKIVDKLLYQAKSLGRNRVVSEAVTAVNK